MITVSESLAGVIRAGGFRREYVADLIVDGERVLEDVSLASCELKWDGNAKVRGQGRAVFVYSDAVGRSVVPEAITSWLTPYASFLNVSMRVSAGAFTEKVLRGTFKIVGVSDPEDRKIPFQNRLISVGSRVSLQLADHFAVTDRERFPAPFAPTDLTSTWGEIGRLTGLPLNQNMADATIPRSVTYDDNRLDAVFDLAAILGGVPYVDPNGAVTIDPDEWGVETDPLNMGATGTVTRIAPHDLSDEGIYNQVVVRSHDESQATILATAEVREGPLRYGGPFGRIPFFVSSQYVTRLDQAKAYAADQLAKVSTVPAVPYTIQCLPDPRREVGDVVPFSHEGKNWLGRIREVTLPDVGPMTLKVLVRPGVPVEASELVGYGVGGYGDGLYGT